VGRRLWEGVLLLLLLYCTVDVVSAVYQALFWLFYSGLQQQFVVKTEMTPSLADSSDDEDDDDDEWVNEVSDDSQFISANVLTTRQVHIYVYQITIEGLRERTE